ncbi:MULTISPECIES: tripartite tricarboxylate transporter TctB family protein [Aeromicrobium]|uniref:Tripartite tricarboxylate transporter TctB family protein n=1 Tax=Aeromicrobium yanjiei TaxID=2662028 RepID=A0A5Q2MEU1_9ACTN|nr:MULTISPECIES: tripartite tricarboxylate transporter TctB family protein [Aeromicrobium]MRK01586.1 tripartite tricarboxylate transporter TctB family protein [Aeromicrobium sp. S22]QGG41647.1 tripartite tricarboxylate transporter TctB family protein [Aeromicrobium yanjiei]
MSVIDKPTEAGTRIIDKAQYAMAAFIGVVGAYILYDATTLEDGFADQPVQPYAFPYAVGAVLLGLAVLLAIATARGDVPQAEEGEDVDLTQPSDWATVAKLVAVFAVNIALIDWLGWAITGAILFVGTAWVLGSRTLIRDVGVGVALSVGTWYGFYSGLGLAIPAGVLDGIL